jgi:hypothetical protein
MAFDLIGQKGGSFYTNFLWWGPLWGYAAVMCGDILTKEEIEGGRYNDGTFIPGLKATEMGKRLRSLVESGETAKFVEECEAYIRSVPDEPCWCNDTEHGPVPNPACTSCNGTGMRGPRFHPFHVENVRNFAKFCLESDGFSIW